jgi:hypothetical protein
MNEIVPTLAGVGSGSGRGRIGVEPSRNLLSNWIGREWANYIRVEPTQNLVTLTRNVIENGVFSESYPTLINPNRC